MLGADPSQKMAENYRRFAHDGFTGSRVYEELCEGVAGDPEMLVFLAQQPASEASAGTCCLRACGVLFGLRTATERSAPSA